MKIGRDHLKGNNAIYCGGILVNLNYSFSGGHHHLYGKAGVVPVFRQAFTWVVHGEHSANLFFLSFRYNKLKSI